MDLSNIKKTNPNYPNEQIRKDMQQPLRPDGTINRDFDKIYGKDKNPWTKAGVPRDAVHKASHSIPSPAPWLVGEPNSPERLNAIKQWEESQKGV